MCFHTLSTNVDSGNVCNGQDTHTVQTRAYLEVLSYGLAKHIPTVHVWRSENNLCEYVRFVDHGGSSNGNQHLPTASNLPAEQLSLPSPFSSSLTLYPSLPSFHSVILSFLFYLSLSFSLPSFVPFFVSFVHPSLPVCLPA